MALGGAVLLLLAGRQLDQAGVPHDLCGDLVVRQTGAREQGDLLATSNRVHDVDRGDTCEAGRDQQGSSTPPLPSRNQPG